MKIKTEQEIKAKIKELEKDYKHLLTGSVATIAVNAPRALGQLSVESALLRLHWVLGTTYKSKLKGIDC